MDWRDPTKEMARGRSGEPMMPVWIHGGDSDSPTDPTRAHGFRVVCKDYHRSLAPYCSATPPQPRMTAASLLLFYTHHATRVCERAAARSPSACAEKALHRQIRAAGPAHGPRCGSGVSRHSHEESGVSCHGHEPSQCSGTETRVGRDAGVDAVAGR
jgi:hypothetical protein